VSLREADFPPSLERLGGGVFEGSGLVELDLGALRGGLVLTISSVGNCSALVSLTIPDGATIEGWALSGTKLKRLRIGLRVRMEATALRGTRIEEIELSDANEAVNESLNGLLLLASVVSPATVRVRTGVLVDVVPTRIVYGVNVFIVEEGAAILLLEAVELAVVGEMPESFPASLRLLDLFSANVTTLSSVHDLPSLRHLVVPVALEYVDDVSFCPRLEKIVFGDAPVRGLGDCAFQADSALEQFSVPAVLRSVDWEAFRGASISSLDASQCASLERFEVGGVLDAAEIKLPIGFSGTLANSFARSISCATFGANKLLTVVSVLVFGEARFTALVPPRGDFAGRMFEKAFPFSETAQLLTREAAPARPP
jgi:hypothetical protein